MTLLNQSGSLGLIAGYTAYLPMCTSVVAYAGKTWLQVDPAKVAVTTLSSSCLVLAARCFCFDQKPCYAPTSLVGRATVVALNFLPHIVGLTLGWLQPIEAIHILGLTTVAHASYYLYEGCPSPHVAGLDLVRAQ